MDKENINIGTILYIENNKTSMKEALIKMNELLSKMSTEEQENYLKKINIIQTEGKIYSYKKI